MNTQEPLFDMPAPTVGDERVYTPQPLADWVVHFLARPQPAWHIVEPHAGGGAFVRALHRLAMVKVTAFDNDPDCPAVRQGLATHADFLRMHLSADLIVGNPPFSEAEQHVEHALTIAPRVMFLLPMSRLETPRRSAWYRRSPLRCVITIPHRVWSGSRQIGVFWWDTSWKRPPHLLVMDELVMDDVPVDQDIVPAESS